MSQLDPYKQSRPEIDPLSFSGDGCWYEFKRMIILAISGLIATGALSFLVTKWIAEGARKEQEGLARRLELDYRDTLQKQVELGNRILELLEYSIEWDLQNQGKTKDVNPFKSELGRAAKELKEISPGKPAEEMIAKIIQYAGPGDESVSEESQNQNGKLACNDTVNSLRRWIENRKKCLEKHPLGGD